MSSRSAIRKIQGLRSARVALLAAASFACVAALGASDAQAGDFKRAFHDELGRIAAQHVTHLGHAIAFGPPIVVHRVELAHARPHHRRGWHRPAKRHYGKRHHWKRHHRHHARRHHHDRGCAHASHEERGHRRGADRHARGERRYRDW